jgi:hypothetical protein
MALVYSQQRAGKPRLAILGALVLLGLTVALAYAVMVHKGHLYSVSLGPEKAYPAGRIRAKLPAGWEKVDEEGLPAGTLAAVTSSPDHYADQTLYLFRGISIDYPPRKRSLIALGRFARELFPDQELHVEEITPSRFGPYPAWSALLWFTPKVTEDYFDAFPQDFLMGCVLNLPNGETVALALRSDDLPRRRDEILLEQVIENVRIAGMNVADDPRRAQDQAGMRFSLPPGSRVIAPPDDVMPQLRVMVGHGKQYWDATITCVPLVGDRTPEAIVTDILLEKTLKVEPPEDVAFLDTPRRRVAHAGIPGFTDEQSVVQHCYCARVDAETALLIVAGGEDDAIESMTRECSRIAAEAEVDDISTWIDVTDARERARKWLRRVELEGLDTYLADIASTGSVFTSYDPGKIFRGLLSYSYRISEQDDRWWEVLFQLDLSYDTDTHIRHQQASQIRNDGRAHRENLHITGKEIDVVYTEHHAREGDLERTLVIEGEGEFEESFRPSDSFVNTTLLEHLYREIALEEQAGPAIFTSTSELARGEHAWIVHPLGRRAVPWLRSEGQAVEARAVRVLQDYDPEYFDAYYDGDGRWLGVMFSDGHWFEEGRPSIKNGGDLLKNLRKLLLNESEK